MKCPKCGSDKCIGITVGPDSYSIECESCGYFFED